MDYQRPVEALIPGVQGRVLGVLTRTDRDLTMRGVAELAAVSPQQASVVIGRLVDLGIVDRHDFPPSSLVRLSSDSLAADLVRELASIGSTAVTTLKQLANDISPPPASLTLFGSFARGEADADSDVDVLVVRPRGTDADSDRWTDSLGSWVDRATRAMGNQVNIVEVAEDEIPALLRRKKPSLWSDVTREGVLLAGDSVADLARVG